MRWLLYGSLTPAVADALRRHKHDARSAADVGLSPDALPGDILKEAQKQQLDLITNDANLANAAHSQNLAFGRSIVFLNVEPGDVEQDDAVDRLFERYKRLTPGRLYTVTGSRVKVRQLPGKR